MSLMRRVRSPRNVALSLAGLLTAAMTGCGLAGGQATAGLDTVVVGSSDFTEHALLGEIYAQAIEAKGVKVERRLNVGAREAYMNAIQGDNPSLNVLPEYIGLVLEYYKKKPTGTGVNQMVADVKEVLPKSLEILQPSNAADEDAFVVTRPTAAKYGLKTMDDLSKVAGELVMGASAPAKTRWGGLVGLKEAYGATFKDVKTVDAGGPLELKALLSNEVQASIFYTTQSAIQENGLVVLKDTKGIFAKGNVTPLIRSDVPQREKVVQALNDVSAALTTEDLTTMVKRIDVGKEPPQIVAKDFLAKSGLN